MRILFVTPYYHPELRFGGPPKRIHAISRQLIGRGHQVRVVTFHSEHPKALQAQRYDGVTVDYMPWAGRSLRQVPTQLSCLRNAIAEADVVHCYGLYNLLCPLAAWLSIRDPRPYLLEPMGMFVPRVKNLGLKQLYHAAFTGWMARKAAAVVATSALERDELLHLNTANVVVRRNGIDVDDFAELPSPQLFRDRWAASPEDRIILYLGRINAKKNLEQLIRAFSLAGAPDALLVIAGPCDQYGYLEMLRGVVDSLEPRPHVVFEEAQYGQDHLAALSAADLFVMPSLNENFGNAAGEAVAAGVPVLLTDTCGIAPLIHGRAGLAVPLGVESIADGIRRMLTPEVRDQMTAKREDVKRELSWEEPIAQTIGLYEEIIRNAKGGSRKANEQPA